jgi:hypothetical protein
MKKFVETLNKFMWYSYAAAESYAVQVSDTMKFNYYSTACNIKKALKIFQSFLFISFAHQLPSQDPGEH